MFGNDSSSCLEGILEGRVLAMNSPREMRKHLLLRLYLGVSLRSAILFPQLPSLWDACGVVLQIKCV